MTVAPGQEVLVKHHQNWGRRCVADVAPEIKIVRPPKNGTVEVRPGDFVVKGNVQSNLVCVGQTLPGVGVYYRAAATEGADSFRYVVTLGGTSHVQTVTRIETEVEISVK